LLFTFLGSILWADSYHSFSDFEGVRLP